MPETASQILSYRGDAALGAGANADIPVINPNLNLDIINKTADNIALQNHEDNIRLYNQKIADRDAALQLFQQGLVSSGNIEDSDRPEYDRAKQKTEEAFYDMMAKGGINNQEAFKNYLDKAKNLNDVVTWAQGRESELSKLRQEKSQQTLPTLVQAYQDHIDQEKQKPFWDAVNPYQQAFNYDVHQSFSDVTGQPISQGILSPKQTQTGITKVDTTTTKGGQTTTKETVKQQPLKSGLVNNKTSKSPITISGTQVNADGTMSPYSFTPEMYYDLPTIQKNVNDNYASNPTDNYTYGQWFKDFQNVNKLPPAQQKESVEAMNKRIAEYSEQRGIKPLDGQFNPDGTPKYPDQITYYQRPDGSVILQETPPSFFAKSALANVNGDYVQRPQTLFNKDIAKYNIDLKNASANDFYKYAAGNAALRKAGAYAGYMSEKLKTMKNEEQQDNFLDEIYNKNIINQNLVGAGETKNRVVLANIPANKSLPVYTLDDTGKPKTLLPNTDARGDNYYKPLYYINGKELSVNQLSNAYQNFKKSQGKNWNGSFQDWLKEGINDPQTGLKVKLQGANGITDEDISRAAQRIISNKGTKKGQVGVFDNTEQPPIEDNVQSDQTNQQETNSDNNQ